MLPHVLRCPGRPPTLRKCRAPDIIGDVEKPHLKVFQWSISVLYLCLGRLVTNLDPGPQTAV